MSQTPHEPTDSTAYTPIRHLSRFSKTYHALTAFLAGGILLALMWGVSITSAITGITDRNEWFTLIAPLFLLVPLILLVVINAYDFGRKRAEDKVGKPVKPVKASPKARAQVSATTLAGPEQTAILRSGIRLTERRVYATLAALERQDETTLATLAEKQDITLSELTEVERAAFLANEKNRLTTELERIELMRQEVNRHLTRGEDPFSAWLDGLTPDARETARAPETPLDVT